MTRYNPGDVIALCFEDDDPDAFFVRGHVPAEEAEAALAQQYGADGDFYTWGMPQRAWGRWSCEPTPDGPGQVLRDYDSPGRGRFPIMRAKVTWRRVYMLGHPAKCECCWKRLV